MSVKAVRGKGLLITNFFRALQRAAFHSFRVCKLTYYAEISTRLNMKKPFVSLTKLTKTDLERVYTMVLRDAL
jgi:hypothetical protein